MERDVGDAYQPGDIVMHYPELSGFIDLGGFSDVRFELGFRSRALRDPEL